MKNNHKKKNFNQTRMILKIIALIVFLGLVAILSIPTIGRELSFYNLKKGQSQVVMNIIRDKKITYSEINTLVDKTRKYTYKSFACLYQDNQEDLDECNKAVSTAEERNYEYIKLGMPASEGTHMTVAETREYLGTFLKDNDYIYDRYALYPGEELQILFNSKKGDNSTIMLIIDLEDNPHEISSLVIGKTDIFDHNY